MRSWIVVHVHKVIVNSIATLSVIEKVAQMPFSWLNCRSIHLSTDPGGMYTHVYSAIVENCAHNKTW